MHPLTAHSVAVSTNRSRSTLGPGVISIRASGARVRLTHVAADAAATTAMFASSEPVVDVDAARLRLATAVAAAPPMPGRNARRAPAPRRPLGAWGGRVMAGVACAAAASVLLVVSGGAQDFLSLFQPSQFAAGARQRQRRPIPRGSHGLRDGDRWIHRHCGSRPRPTRLRPVRWRGLPPRWSRVPAGVGGDASLRGGQWHGRFVHLLRRPRSRGCRPVGWSAAGHAGRPRREHAHRFDRCRRLWCRTASTSAPSTAAADRCRRADRRSSSSHLGRRPCRRPG